MHKTMYFFYGINPGLVTMRGSDNGYDSCIVLHTWTNIRLIRDKVYSFWKV